MLFSVLLPYTFDKKSSQHAQPYSLLHPKSFLLVNSFLNRNSILTDAKVQFSRRAQEEYETELPESSECHCAAQLIGAWRDRARCSPLLFLNEQDAYSRCRCGMWAARIWQPTTTEQGQAGHHAFWLLILKTDIETTEIDPPQSAPRTRILQRI